MRVARRGRFPVLLIAAAFAVGAWAQTFVYPGKGQSADQQKTDESACHTWAVQQSKDEPANPPPPPATAAPKTTATGTTPGAGADGAVGGEIVGDDAGTGAAGGAAAARGQSRRQNSAQAQQQQLATQQSQAGMNAYQKARAACLEGRGYTVR
jgi:hypothetical protein